MLTIGDKFPEFKIKGVVSNDISNAFVDINDETYKGKWLCVFFWPKDFTFVCPTEISAFGDLNQDFQSRNCQILGASIDSEFVHLAWRKENKDLNNLPFPMLADVTRDLSFELGILGEETGVANRATFLVDPEGTIRFVSVTDLNVGRNPQEVLRVLDALQSGGLCGCNWKKGDQNIKVS